MKVIITTRRCKVPGPIRERAKMLIERAAKKASRPYRAEIIFQEDHRRSVVELHLFLPRGKVNVCTAEADDFRSALDRAMDKLNNQLDKARDAPHRGASAS
ncbi:MAG: HPF/RaiA family ribosome-associated protein [Myxococcales bacterium]|nr:HPF/RaiA family ribosome-associated protein [Myxococcales bacterium]